MRGEGVEDAIRERGLCQSFANALGCGLRHELHLSGFVVNQGKADNLHDPVVSRTSDGGAALAPERCLSTYIKGLIQDYTC